MACPTSQDAVRHIVTAHRVSDDAIPFASVGSAAQQIWARNVCPASSPLASVRWRAADYAVTLQHMPVLFEERNLSRSTRARCLCEFPGGGACHWASDTTANLCLREAPR